MYHNSKYIICKKNAVVSRSVSNDARNCYQFCAILGLKQIIIPPTNMTCRNTSLIDYLLAGIPSRFSQHGVINVDVSKEVLYKKE